MGRTREQILDAVEPFLEQYRRGQFADEEDERWCLDPLICELEEALKHGVLVPDAPDLSELFAARRELQVEQDENSRLAVEWAEGVELSFRKVPSNVDERAEQYFGGWCGEMGVWAYIRHTFTNYDTLLDQCPIRISEKAHPDAREALRLRFDQAYSLLERPTVDTTVIHR